MLNMRNIIVTVYLMLVAAPSALGKTIFKRTDFEEPAGNHFQFKLPRQPDHVDRSPRQLGPNNVVHRSYPWHSNNAHQLPRRPYQRSGMLNQNKRPLTSYHDMYELTVPVTEHLMAMQKTPLLDTDAYFDEDLNFDLYRPVQENCGCHHMDEHMIPRPSFPWLHSQLFPRPSQENVYFTRHAYNPLYVGPDNKPAFQPVLIRPGHSGHVSFLPPSSLEQSLHDSLPYAYMVKPSLITKPVYEQKTGFVIIANNINMNHPMPQQVDPVRDHLHNIDERPWMNAANGFTNNTMLNDNCGNTIGGQLNSGIRFDHVRDHHIIPGSFNNEYINIPYGLMPHFATVSKDMVATLDTEMSFKQGHPAETLNNAGGTETIPSSQFKPNNQSVIQNGAFRPITSAAIQLLTAGEKEHTSLETSHQISKASSIIPNSKENESQLHPMLSPMPILEDTA